MTERPALGQGAAVIERSINLARRLATLEAIVDHGASQHEAARQVGVLAPQANRWYAQHASGEMTLDDLRSDLVSEQARSMASTAGCTTAQLLERAAPYVMCETAPVEHFYWWLRFYVAEWGPDVGSGSSLEISRR